MPRACAGSVRCRSAHLLGSVGNSSAILSGYVLRRYSVMHELSATTFSPCFRVGICTQVMARDCPAAQNGHRDHVHRMLCAAVANMENTRRSG